MCAVGLRDAMRGARVFPPMTTNGCARAARKSPKKVHIHVKDSTFVYFLNAKFTAETSTT